MGVCFPQDHAMYHHDDGASQQLLLGGCFTAEQFSPLEKFSSLSFFFLAYIKKKEKEGSVYTPAGSIK